MNVLQEKPKQRSSNDAGDDGYNRRRRKDDPLPERDSNDAADDEYDRRRRKDDPMPERDGHSRRNRTSNLRGKHKHGSSCDAEDYGSNQYKRKDDALPERDGHNRGTNLSNLREHDVQERNEKHIRCRGKKGFRDDRYNIPSSSEDEVLGNNRRNSSSSSSIGSFSEEEVESRKPLSYASIPPPYVRWSAANEGDRANAGARESYGFGNAENHDPGVNKDQSQPKSTLKPPPGREILSNGSKGNAKKEEKARQHLQSIVSSYDEDQSDEEEKKLDHLLMHYSKKKQPHESQKSNGNSNHHPGKESDDPGRARPSPGYESDDTSGGRKHRNARSELPHQTGRSTSAPSEAAAGDEVTRGHIRAKSMQPEKIGGLGHVHPKLPDYDDLAARLAALRSN